MTEQQRKIHPNSIKALKDAAAAREVTKIRVNVMLTKTAIAHGTSAADTLNISRSELIERLLRRGEAWLVDVARVDK